MRLLQNLAALSWAGRPCHEGCGTGILPVFHGRDAHATRGVARASCPCSMGGTPMPRGVWHGHLARVPWAGRPCHEGCGTGILPVFASWAGRPCHEGFCKSLTSQAKRFCGGKRYSARRRFSSVRTAAERCTKAVPRPALRPYTSSLTLRPYTSSFYTSSLHFVAGAID